MAEAHPRPRTTASTLGAYRRELIDEGVTPECAEELVQSAAQDLRFDELIVEPPNPSVAELGIRLVPEFDHADLASAVEEARSYAVRTGLAEAVGDAADRSTSDEVARSTTDQTGRPYRPGEGRKPGHPDPFEP